MFGNKFNALLKHPGYNFGGSGGDSGGTQPAAGTPYYRSASGEMLPYDAKTYSGGTGGVDESGLGSVLFRALSKTNGADTPVLYTKNTQGFWVPYTGVGSGIGVTAPRPDAAAMAKIGQTANLNLINNMESYQRQLQQAQPPAGGRGPGLIAQGFQAGLNRAPMGYMTPYQVTPTAGSVTPYSGSEKQ
jgi:hypothetical protein